MKTENTMICCHLEMKFQTLLKAKLYPPPVETTNPAGRPFFSTACPEESENDQGDNGPKPKRLRPNSDVRFDQFHHFPSAINELGQRCKMGG